jgi:hypothetical protein
LLCVLDNIIQVSVQFLNGATLDSVEPVNLCGEQFAINMVHHFSFVVCIYVRNNQINIIVFGYKDRPLMLRQSSAISS